MNPKRVHLVSAPMVHETCKSQICSTRVRIFSCGPTPTPNRRVGIGAAAQLFCREKHFTARLAACASSRRLWAEAACSNRSARGHLPAATSREASMLRAMTPRMHWIKLTLSKKIGTQGEAVAGLFCWAVG